MMCTLKMKAFIKVNGKLARHLKRYLKCVWIKVDIQNVQVTLEKRTGCCNFSVIGRNAEHVDRKDYFNFDNSTGERKFIAVINKTDKPHSPSR